MTTHAAILVQDWNSPCRVYYKTADGGPKHLGHKLIMTLMENVYDLESTDNRMNLEEDIFEKQLGAKYAGFQVDLQGGPLEVFRDNFTDLEWIYLVSNLNHGADRMGVDIYKTSNLVKCPPFVWKVYGRIISYYYPLESLMEELERTGEQLRNMLSAYCDTIK